MKVGWKTVMKQQKLVEKMTIEEKAAILSGKTWTGIYAFIRYRAQGY